MPSKSVLICLAMYTYMNMRLAEAFLVKHTVIDSRIDARQSKFAYSLTYTVQINVNLPQP